MRKYLLWDRDLASISQQIRGDFRCYIGRKIRRLNRLLRWIFNSGSPIADRAGSAGAGARAAQNTLTLPGKGALQREWEERSRPISRVLSGAIIHLGRPSPAVSSDLPGSPFGTDGACRACGSPIWSCSGRGLPCRGVLPPARCALTAPFHPCRRASTLGRYIFCGTFHGLAPSRGYLAPCPMEPGLSSA